MLDLEDEAFEALVKIIDPGASNIWFLGNPDPGSVCDIRWKAAKVKAEAVVQVIENAVLKAIGPLAAGHRRCPFCGDEPRLCDPSYNGPADCWDTYIECTGCDARSPGIGREHGDDEDWAVEEAWLQWDRRVIEASRLRTSTSETFIRALNAVVDDVELATRLWASVLAVAGSKPVGWTQPGEIERTLSGEEDVVAQFWSRRDMKETRDLLAQVVDHQVPDDVPLYSAPLNVILSEPRPPEVIDLTWSIGGEGEAQTHYVDTVIGKYAAWVKNSESHVIVPGAVRSQVVGQAIEDALQFAQRHFAGQILAQLKP